MGADYPLWIPCRCGEYWCTVHRVHASECACPGIEALDFDPYISGGARWVLTSQ